MSILSVHSGEWMSTAIAPWRVSRSWIWHWTRSRPFMSITFIAAPSIVNQFKLSHNNISYICLLVTLIRLLVFMAINKLRIRWILGPWNCNKSYLRFFMGADFPHTGDCAHAWLISSCSPSWQIMQWIKLYGFRAIMETIRIRLKHKIGLYLTMKIKILCFNRPLNEIKWVQLTEKYLKWQSVTFPKKLCQLPGK